MAERAVATAKIPETKQICTNSCKQKPNYSSLGSPADRILQLQRTAGNQAVQRLIKSGILQAKLRIGQLNDVYEQEAERVSEQIMRMPDSILQRQKKDEEEKEEIVQTKPLVNHIIPMVQRQVDEEEKEEEPIQRKEAANETPNISPDIHSRITSLRGGGQPLPESTRAFFEPRFGYDFSGVQVHSGADAEQSARDVNAHAYTVGNDIVFGAGRFTPETHEGRRLIAHELTHVVQQNRGGTYTPAPLPSSNLEREADRAASTFMDGGGLIHVVYGSAPGLARQPRSLSQGLNPPSLSDEEIYQEINLIRQWLRDNPSVSPEHDQLMTVMQGLESEVGQRKEKQKPVQAPKSKTSKSASQISFRGVDISKLIDFKLEQEYNTVRQRLLSQPSYPERQADESYLQTIENEIKKREKVAKAANMKDVETLILKKINEHMKLYPELKTFHNQLNKIVKDVFTKYNNLSDLPPEEKAGLWALRQLDVKEWTTAATSPGRGTEEIGEGYKCNKFIADAFGFGAGLGYGTPKGYPTRKHTRLWGIYEAIYPPVANDLADPSKIINNFPVIAYKDNEAKPPQTIPANKLEFGDVIAFYSPGGIGHSGIYLGNGLYISAGATRGGYIEPVSNQEPTHKYTTYRRYTPPEE